jgi:protein-disulfide isomerase
MTKKILYSFLLLALTAPFVLAQRVAPLQAPENSPLKPPRGARVALVVFEDLQCPDCANAAPLLADAVRTYKIPLLRHDFPLQKHNWSKQAAIMARYFDTRSKKIGDEFRDYCFEHQPGHPGLTIQSPEDLRQQAEQFASAHKIALPLVIDPEGRLQQRVEADAALGVSIGISHTPTIYVVTNKVTGTPFVEVVDRTHLYEMIDGMIASTGGSTPAKATSTKSTKPKPTT